MSDDNKYKNGKIYTIRYKNDDSLIYVGSTVQPLYKRFSLHKSNSKIQEKENRQLYKKMNETDINVISGRTKQEWKEDNREQLKERKKEYYKDNKVKINEYTKQRVSERVICECNCNVRWNTIARHKRSPKHQNIMTELTKTLEQTI